MTNVYKDELIVPSTKEPNPIGIDNTPNPAIGVPIANNEPAKVRTCFILRFSVAFETSPIADAKILIPNDIRGITNEPRATHAATAGIPIAAVARAKTTTVPAIIPTCFHVTFSVAFVILPSAIPYKINDVPINAIITEPIKMFFLALFNILNVKIFIATTPITTAEPINAGIPITAIDASAKDATPIIPVNATNKRDEATALPRCLLFLDNFFAAGTIISIIFDITFAPNIAGIPTTAAAVKNIDDINKLPTSAVIFFAVFLLFSISFLFLDSFLDSGINLSTVFSILSIPILATFAHIDVKANFLIALFNEDTSSLIGFAAFAPVSISFLFLAII